MLYLLHTPRPAKLPWSEAQSNSKDISCAVTDTELTWPCPEPLADSITAHLFDLI